MSIEDKAYDTGVALKSFYERARDLPKRIKESIGSFALDLVQLPAKGNPDTPSSRESRFRNIADILRSVDTEPSDEADADTDWKFNS
jgi:hypothetical protein